MRFCLVASAAACLLATATAATAATARVLVVGADASLVHDAVASALTPSDLARRFSPAGLAQLAMDALGLPTGSTPQLLVQSPVQADVFSHVDAYAMVFVDAADADVLSTVDASATSGYHKLFDVTPDETAQVQTIPSALARAMGSSVGARVQCAGTAPLCSDAAAARVTKPQIDAVFEKYAFLDREADATLATTLAQTRALAADLRTAKASPNTLVAVHFDAVRQPKARDAVATEIHDLLAALQMTYPHNSGAQVVAASSSSSVAALQSTTVGKSILAYGRMLLSFNEKLGSSSADEDDEDDDDDDTLLANGTAKSDITIDDIAEYQIVLWTSVILGAALLLVIIAMCNMNNRRDSLLYAKFTTSNASRKFD